MSTYCNVLISGTIGNILQLVGLIIVFVLILFATYYTSRWIGKSGFTQQKAANIQVIETFRLSQTKYIQIIRAGTGRYFVIAVGKDTITYIAELKEEDIILRNDSQTAEKVSFSDIMKKLKKHNEE
ncbi:MAG: flagellar biosynthetic protein FliO [Lachnospiraceae bacterium]|mgnify:CR=1 FL=1|nr:flagellar biosynthetic protein FliO [Lachnospiraceae bacterium]